MRTCGVGEGVKESGLCGTRERGEAAPADELHRGLKGRDDRIRSGRDLCRDKLRVGPSKRIAGGLPVRDRIISTPDRLNQSGGSGRTRWGRWRCGRTASCWDSGWRSATWRCKYSPWATPGSRASSSGPPATPDQTSVKASSSVSAYPEHVLHEHAGVVETTTGGLHKVALCEIVS